jgi:polyhydroxyalkanoate synthesis repressor PhaR
MKAKAIIKKYGNRRLYDTSASRYVNLEDIASMIREGTEVQVLDARSGKDLTRVVLTQIIVEDARDRETALPLPFLRQLVMASDRATHEFLSWYLNTTLDVYQKAQERFRSGLSEAREAVSSPLDFVRNLLGGTRESGEVEELRRRLAELEARLAERSESGRRTRPGKRRGPPPSSALG